uniref:Uncharacterized protein n=1 Tax=Gasterosteus aculeatus TaxID=69293 RepID=G3PEQ6_GASAC
MSTSTQKHRDFVGEPMGDKPVTSLSGIGGILGEKLRHQSLRQGLRGPGSVPASEERPGDVHRVAEGHQRGKLPSGRTLQSVSEGVV